MQGDLHLSILTYLYESTSRNSHIYDIFSSFMRGFVIKNIDMLLDMKMKELNKMDFFIIHNDLLPPTQNATYYVFNTKIHNTDRTDSMIHKIHKNTQFVGRANQIARIIRLLSFFMVTNSVGSSMKNQNNLSAQLIFFLNLPQKLFFVRSICIKTVILSSFQHECQKEKD